MILWHTYSGKHKEAISKRPHSLALRNIYEKFLKQLRGKENRNNAGKKKKEKKKSQESEDSFSLFNIKEDYKCNYGNNGAFPRRNSRREH